MKREFNHQGVDDALTRNYKFNNKEYKRNRIRERDIPKAIEILRTLVDNNFDNIFFDDPESYGNTYADSTPSLGYGFEIDFDNLIASNGLSSKEVTAQNAGLNTEVSVIRDVVLSFDSRMGTSLFQRNGLSISVNGVTKESVISFNGDKSFSFILNRNEFQSGKNQIRIEPTNTELPWGIKNIKAEFTPVIELVLNQVDRNQYGSDENADLERPTGLRASFSLEDTSEDVVFFVTGWEVSGSDEVAVFLNGKSYGFLSSKLRMSDRYSPPDTFTFSKDDVAEGSNNIELIQKNGGRNWGVKNLFVVLDGSSPTLALGVNNGVKYGSNYGTNENPLLLDVKFLAQSQHDHQISWKGFDIERNTDLEVYINGSLLKTMNTTGNNRLGNREKITVASRTLNSGSNTLSFRLSATSQDQTWGITDLLVDTSPIIDLNDENNLDRDFGYFVKHRAGIPLGWRRSYSEEEYQSRLHATFTSTATRDETIVVTGWDIDFDAEVSVYVNGNFLQHLTSSTLSSAYSKTDRIVIPKDQLIQGENKISFRASDTSRGFQNEKWGVLFGEASNVSIAALILLLLSNDD